MSFFSIFISTANAAGSPLKQFEIYSIAPMHFGNVNVSFTNSSFWMLLVVLVSTLVLSLGVRRSSLVPNRLQSISELLYEFIANMVRDNASQDGKPYFPFIFTLFIFILFSNVLGLIPYSFTVTSHIIVTFALAMVVFIGVTIIGLVKHRIKFFTLFVPKGIPLALAPLLIIIELISYLVRPITLSVRLFANMMAGHTLLKVFGGFVVALGFLGIGPLVVTVALYGLELIVACLQAYVFAVLTCLYLNDALHLHH
ncbi:MAG: ATP synthase subunit a [Alphaproteobacteria bacterium MarineAlpha2_Bin1]|nr:MAG: ATP synthase subunit a [Alphaproteobacteria bacterium MarineAlpha2_Bin1]